MKLVLCLAYPYNAVKIVEEHFRDKFTADLISLPVHRGHWHMRYLTVIHTNNHELRYEDNQPALYPYTKVYNEEQPLAIKVQFEEVIRFLFKTLPRRQDDRTAEKRDRRHRGTGSNYRR